MVLSQPNPLYLFCLYSDSLQHSFWRIIITAFLISSLHSSNCIIVWGFILSSIFAYQVLRIWCEILRVVRVRFRLWEAILLLMSGSRHS